MSRSARPNDSFIVFEISSCPHLLWSRDTASRISQHTPSSSSSFVRIPPVARLTPISEKNGAESPYRSLKIEKPYICIVRRLYHKIGKSYRFVASARRLAEYAIGLTRLMMLSTNNCLACCPKRKNLESLLNRVFGCVWGTWPSFRNGSKSRCQYEIPR